MKKPLSNYWNRKRRAYILKHGLRAWDAYLRRRRQKRYWKTPKGCYVKHKNNAKQRGIEWHFTFDSWLKVWKESGHFEERGHAKGKFVMARIGDCGPYAEWNVRIVRSEANACAGMMHATIPRLSDRALRDEIATIL